MKREIQVGYDTDTHWIDILQQLESVQDHRQHQGAREYRLAPHLLAVCDSTGQDKRWKIVNPYVPGIIIIIIIIIIISIQLQSGSTAMVMSLQIEWKDVKQSQLKSSPVH